MSGYHLSAIPVGVYGEVSKIEEEFLEFKDAILQQNRLMALIELSDLIGAIEGYAKENGSTLSDLITMSQATKRAFEDGHRTPKKSKDS